MNPLNVRARAWSRQEWRQFRWDERVVEPSVEPEEEYLISSVAFVVYFFYPARVILICKDTCNIICTFAQLYIVNSVFTQITMKKKQKYRTSTWGSLRSSNHLKGGLKV